jgi:hypothetical protein
LDIEDVYDSNHSWSELREAAGLPVEGVGPENGRLRRACGRVLHIDDLNRIDTYQRFLSSGPPDVNVLSIHDQRLLRMLVASVTGPALERDTSLEAAIRLLWAHPQVILELREILEVLRQRVNHVHHSIANNTEVPLRVHARYTRTEILSAFSIGGAAMPPEWREGVRFLRDARVDLFVFTLDKTDGQFSPTTRYKDYAISRDLIHWESQWVRAFCCLPDCGAMIARSGSSGRRLT